MKNSKNRKIILNEKAGAYDGNINGWSISYYPPGNVELSGGELSQGKGSKTKIEKYSVLLLSYRFPEASNPENITEIFCSRIDKGDWYVSKHVADDRKNKYPESFVCNTKGAEEISSAFHKLGLNISFPSDNEVESFISSCS